MISSPGRRVRLAAQNPRPLAGMLVSPTKPPSAGAKPGFPSPSKVAAALGLLRGAAGPGGRRNSGAPRRGAGAATEEEGGGVGERGEALPAYGTKPARTGAARLSPPFEAVGTGGGGPDTATKSHYAAPAHSTAAEKGTGMWRVESYTGMFWPPFAENWVLSVGRIWE